MIRIVYMKSIFARIAREDAGMTRFRVFYSYSHADEKYRERLETHLSVLRRQGLIREWHDRKIFAGDHWKDEIDLWLDKSQIVLLLVTASFIASEYCFGKEMKRALELHEDGFAQVIPCSGNMSGIFQYVSGHSGIPRQLKLTL